MTWYIRLDLDSEIATSLEKNSNISTTLELHSALALVVSDETVVYDTGRYDEIQYDGSVFG